MQNAMSNPITVQCKTFSTVKLFLLRTCISYYNCILQGSHWEHRAHEDSKAHEPRQHKTWTSRLQECKVINMQKKGGSVDKRKAGYLMKLLERLWGAECVERVEPAEREEREEQECREEHGEHGERGGHEERERARSALRMGRVVRTRSEKSAEYAGITKSAGRVGSAESSGGVRTAISEGCVERARESRTAWMAGSPR